MSATDDGAATADPRVCSNCEGFGRWRGDRSDGDLLVGCEECGRRWTAPDRDDEEGGAD